jgi:hypothetical protein
MRADAGGLRAGAPRTVVFRQTLDLGTVTKLAVAGNGANEAMLGLKGVGPRTFVSLLHLSGRVKRSLDATRLRELANAIERFVPDAAEGKAETVMALIAQAAFEQSGGAPADSPLAPIADGSLARTSGSAGIAVSIFTLLK